MPERVTFTRKSADRIAKVVKRVENMPAAEPIQQRRRAGGYRMESLWEVTVVNTTDKVVTLKRVQDTDDNLNDRSETIDVAYDPDNEPAVGDRGLIIRLGDGTRFFFKRGVGQNIIFINEWAEVRSDSPTTRYSYSGDGSQSVRAYSSTDGTLYYAVMKLAGSPYDIDATYAILRSGTNVVGLSLVSTETGPSSLDLREEVYGIYEDFDMSLMTWNYLAGLDTDDMAAASKNTLMRSFSWTANALLRIRGQHVGGISWETGNLDLRNVGSSDGLYGIYYKLQTVMSTTGHSTLVFFLGSPQTLRGSILYYI